MDLLHRTRISRIAPWMDRLREQIVAAYGARGEVTATVDAGADPGERQRSPLRLGRALASLVHVLNSYAAEREAGRRPLDRDELTDLGEEGTLLLEDLADWTRRLELAEAEAETRELALAFSVWVAREGGELRRLAPVVESIGVLANRLRHPERLAELDEVAEWLMNAVVRPPAETPEAAESDRDAWRVLVLNRAIIATRSLDPKRMEAAFDELNHYLPEHAAKFFQEGMEQMDRIGYPLPVRAVMARYFQTWAVTTLH